MVTRLLFKMTLRELKKNWFQYLSTFAITALAVTLFLGFISNTVTLQKRTELYFEASDLAGLIAQTTTFDEGDKEYFSSLGGAEYRIFSDGEFTDGKQSSVAKIFVTDGSPQMNRPYLDEASGSKEGFLIDKTVADLFGYEIGEELTVEFTTFRGFFSDLTAEFLERYPILTLYGDFRIPSSYVFPVTGLMYSVEGVNIYSVSPVFFTEDTVCDAIAGAIRAQLPESLPIDEASFTESLKSVVREVLDGMYNQALLKTDDPSVKEGIEARFAQKEENNLRFVYDRDTMESVALLDNERDQSRNMLYVFPVIFFLVSVLVILTNISRLILRERVNIGTLKALGIGNGRIILHYALISAFVTLLGCIVGAVAGPLIVPNVMTIKYGLVYSMPMLSGILFSVPWTIGVTAVVCLLAVLIGFWAARSVIRENPAECMRPKQITYTPRVRRGTGRSKESRHILLSYRMALRNIRINWGRSLMTVIGVMGCTALLVTSFGMGDTLLNSVNTDYGENFRYDVASSYAPQQEEAFFSRLDEMETSGEIGGYERLRTYAATVRTEERSRDVTVYVLQEDATMTTVLSGGGNALSAITAEQVGVKAGDMITFTLGARTVEYRVDAIVETSTRNGFFTSENKFDEDCYYQETVWVKTQNADAVRDELNEISGTNTAKTMADRRGEIENLISSTNVMKYTMMTFAILLSVVVLYNLSLLNVKERSRDMATMKVLGFGNAQVALALIMEIMFLTVVGTAFGMALGYPLLYLVMKLNELTIMAFLYSISLPSYLLAAFGSLATALVINAFFGLLISRINMTESLKSVE